MASADVSDAKRAVDGYKESLNQYTGNAGSMNALNQGKIIAAEASKGAGESASRQSRTSGMSSSASAGKGAEIAAQGYYQQLQPSTQLAMQSGMNNLQGYSNLHKLELDQKAADYGYSWTNAKNIMNMAGTLLGTMGSIAGGVSGGGGAGAAGAAGGTA